MAVTFDAKMTGGDLDTGRCQGAVAATTVSSTGMTVGGSATLLVGVLVFGASTGTPPTSVTMTWNGVPMTLRANVISDVGSPFAAAYTFTLVSPAIGNLTLAAAWTGANDAYMSCVSFIGTDAVTGVNAADNTTATQTTTISPPTDANGATVACFGVDGADPTVDQTEIFSTAPNSPGGGASYAIGGSGTNTHSFTGAGGTAQALAAVHVITPAVPADRDVLIRFGAMDATFGSGLVTAAFATGAFVEVLGGGAYLMRRRLLDAMTCADDL